MFAAFRVRSFRYQWPADLLTSWAAEMETLILGWYVMVNTGSVLMLTAFASLQSLGTLAAPVFGVLGDRLGVRTMLCAMRATYAVLATVVMILALAGVLTPVWVLVIATLAGVVRPNDLVMRTALLAAMVLAFVINLSAYPVTSGLLPYVARDIYMVDSRGLAWLVASFSLGGLVGSIAIVLTGGPRQPGRAMVVYAALWYALLLG